MPHLSKFIHRPRFPLCSLCNEAVELETSKADEDGKAIHEECYVVKASGKTGVMANTSRFITVSQSVGDFFNTLSTLPRLLRCRRCGSKLLHLDATFFSQSRKVWTLPLP